MLRRYTGLCSPLTCVYEKPLLLSQKSLLGMGRARCDLQESPHTICKCTGIYSARNMFYFTSTVIFM